MGAFDALLRETMVLAAILCVPVLAIAALVGTSVAIVQAATQVQEQQYVALFFYLAQLVLLGQNRFWAEIRHVLATF